MENLPLLKNIKLKTQLFIDGEFVDGVKGQKIPVLNPATEEVIAEVSEATEEDVEKAIRAAKRGFELWSKVSLDERTRLLNQLAQKLEDNLEEFVLIESLDNGKPLNDSREDLKDVVRQIRYYAGGVETVMGHTLTTTDEYTIQTRRVPFGVVGCIAQWNYPLQMCSWKIFPAIAAGNAVVLKPSEETPLTILKLATFLQELKFPPGVLNIVPGYGPIAGAYFSNSHQVNKMSFTGSAAVGRLVMKASAESNLKNVHLELGGKSPMVVFADADIDNALEWVIDGAFRNSAQNCSCGSRLFLEESIYDNFVKRLVDRTSKIKVGPYDEEGVLIGPLINAKQFKNCLNYIQSGKDENLELAFGGQKSKNFSKGYFVDPTIFINVSDSSKLAREEIFGPVLCVLKAFKTVDEVIERANDTTYGLASAVFTSDMNKAEYFIRKLEAGTVWVNYYNASPYNVAFGGMKQSGFGRDNGLEGLMECTTTKSVYYKFNFNFQK